MATKRKLHTGIDVVVDFFPASSHKMIEKLLLRAQEEEARRAGRNVAVAMRDLGHVLSGSGSRRTDFGMELGKALRLRGDVRGKASIRQKAPDTGGRPFHFAHSVVGKERSPAAASKRSTDGSSTETTSGDGTTSARSGGTAKIGSAAAHMRYIEREVAVETAHGSALERDDRSRSEQAREGEVEASPAPRAYNSERDHVSGAGPGQGYIENPAKLANGEQIIFSFGTIGQTFEDRVRFWEALEEAEAHPNARVQHRLIVELPHEASPQARFDIVKKFAERFEQDGVPFWAALHAPGKHNDSRNYHAHIVYSERPAKRMRNPDDPSAAEEWDFAIVKRWKSSSRHQRQSRPYRQDKLRAYHALDFIPKLRRKFSAITNEVLTRDDVRDRDGAEVRYDARSYRDMGVDAVPMRSINRIVADKVKGGKNTVLDGAYTKRMITAELRESAAKRQKDVLALIAIDDAVRAATASGAKARQGPQLLPKELRPSPLASVSRAMLKPVGERLMKAKHEALQVDVMERAAIASLERVIAATSPKAVEAIKKSKSAEIRAQSPDAEALHLLHAAALAELEETREVTAKKRRSLRYQIGAAVEEWRELVKAPTSTMSATMKRILQEMDAPAQPQAAALVKRQGEATVALSPDAARTPSRASVQTDRSEEAPRAADPIPRDAALSIGTPTGSAGDAPRPIPARPEAGPRLASGRTTSPLETKAPRNQLPKSMRAVRGVPTAADLVAASTAVSGWIKNIADTVEGPEARMAAVEQLLIDFGAMLKGKKTALATGMELRHDGGTALGEVEPADQMWIQERQTAMDEIATVAVASDTPSIRLMETTAVTLDDREPSREIAEPSQPAERVGPADDRTDAEVTVEPDADTKRRLREREEELEKRRKKRKAVLGRRNKGLGR